MNSKREKPDFSLSSLKTSKLINKPNQWLRRLCTPEPSRSRATYFSLKHLQCGVWHHSRQKDHTQAHADVIHRRRSWSLWQMTRIGPGHYLLTSPQQHCHITLQRTRRKSAWRRGERQVEVSLCSPGVSYSLHCSTTPGVSIPGLMDFSNSIDYHSDKMISILKSQDLEIFHEWNSISVSGSLYAQYMTEVPLSKALNPQLLPRSRSIKWLPTALVCVQLHSVCVFTVCVVFTAVCVHLDG